MNRKAIEIQIYFEIAMAIGNELNLQKMLRSALSAYLRKLSCATGMVLQFSKNNGTIVLEPCFSIPKNSINNPVYQTILQELPQQFRGRQLLEFTSSLPCSGSVNQNLFFHISNLPDFGLLILIKSGQPLESYILHSLRQLNTKLASSCIACRQNERMESINRQLNFEVEQRRIADLKVKELLGSLENQVIERTRALEASQKRYKTLFDNIQDIYFSLDLDGNVLEISPSVETLLHYDKNRLIGKGVESIGLAALEPAQFLKKLRKDNRIKDYPLTISADDGKEHYFSMNATLVQATESGELQVIGSMRDITLQRQMEKTKKELEEQLLNSRKMEALGLLAGGVAHDLNNVLSGIVSYPDLLLSQLDEDSDLRSAITVIRDSGAKAAAIVQDLLTMARRGVVHKDIINLNDVIKEHLDSPEFKEIVHNHLGLTIVTELSQDLLNMQGSALHLKKTLMNLVHNSAEAGASEITIVTENRYIEGEYGDFQKMREGDYIVLKVIDNGAGISEEEQKRIFEPFYTKKVMGRSGTGLGMFVVWGTVVDHSGYIDIESEPGEKTTIQLLLAASREEIRMKKTEEPASMHLAQGETILIVDDCKDQRQIARSILKSLGYSVHVAESGEKAVTMLQENKPDLVLLDMIMEPGMDGLDTYKEIIRHQPEAKVVIATGYSESERVREALRLGVLKYIRKPYLLKTIGITLRQCLA